MATSRRPRSSRSVRKARSKASRIAVWNRWGRRGRDRFLALREGLVTGVTITNPGQAQFGIVQGSVFPALREESACRTVEIGFEAYAIGGLSVGEPADVMYDMVSRTTSCL